MATPDQPSSGKCTLPITNEKIDGDTTTVGSITFAQSGFLGKGASSTVFRGQCDMRQEVAIKRIHYRTDGERLLIENEVGNLLKVEEDDMKVIRYFMTQRTANFYYIAMELALGTVEDYVERKQGVHTKPDMDELANFHEISIFRDSSKALEWLHQQRIVHRDIKPSNLMLVKSKKGEIVTKLADFGISKEMTASKLKMTAGVGTLDWMAPEAHAGEYQQGTEKTADIFSLGCVFHYIIFPGKHPFGDMSDRMANIQQGKPCLANIEDPKSVNVATRHLIEEMIQHDPTERPSSTYVVNHPALWTTEKTKKFFQAVSDCIKDDRDHGPALKEAVDEELDLAFVAEPVKLKEWKKVVDATLDKKAFETYQETTADLLRFIRNKVHHFNDISKEGREKVDNETIGMVSYITGEFPTLLLHVWLAAASIGSALDILRPFYTESRPPKMLVPREHEKTAETQVPLPVREPQAQVRELQAQVRELQHLLKRALADKKRTEDDLKELRATNSSTEIKLRETEVRSAHELTSRFNDLEKTNAALQERLQEMERMVEYESSSYKEKYEKIMRMLEDVQQHVKRTDEFVNAIYMMFPRADKSKHSCNRLVPREQEEGVQTQVRVEKVHALVDQQRVEDDLKLDHERSSRKDKDEMIKSQQQEMQQQKEKQLALMNTKGALDEEISAKLQDALISALYMFMNTRQLEAHRRSEQRGSMKRKQVPKDEMHNIVEGMDQTMNDSGTEEGSMSDAPEEDDYDSGMGFESDPNKELSQPAPAENLAESGRSQGQQPGPSTGTASQTKGKTPAVHLLLGDNARDCKIKSTFEKDSIINLSEGRVTLQSMVDDLDLYFTRWRNEADKFGYKIGSVIIWVSSNDIYCRGSGGTADEEFLKQYSQDLKKLVERAVKYAESVIILGPVAYLSYEKNVRWEGTAAFHFERWTMKEVKEMSGVTYVPLGRCLTKKQAGRHTITSECAKWYKEDGIQLSPAGYRKLADAYRLPKWFRFDH